MAAATGIKARARQEMARRAVRAGLALWLTSRVVYLGYAWIVLREWGLRHPAKSLSSSVLGWVSKVYAHSDSAYFLDIARFGYLRHGPNDIRVAFFPGYPLAGRYVADLLALGRTPTTLDYRVALGALSWVGVAVACVLLWMWIEPIAGTRAAGVGVAAMVFGPYSLFYMASYSEGAFLALALAAWLCGRRNNWIAAGLLAGVAALVRIDGLFLVAALTVGYVRHSHAEGRPLLRREAATLPTAILAVAGYFAWLSAATGHWNAWFRAQRTGWFRQAEWPWQTLITSIRRYPATAPNAALHWQAGMELLFAAAYLAVVWALARRRMWPEFTYVAASAATLLSSTFYQSVPRSMILAFPVYLLVGQALTARPGPRRWSVILTVAASTAVLGINTALFVRGYYAG